MTADETGGETGAETGTTGRNEAGTGWRTRALTLLQWVVALGAFWYVARDIDWGETAAELAGVEAWILAAVAVVTVAEFGSRFGMWYVLLNTRRPTGLATTARVDLTIKFVNHVIPSKASGHSVAPLVLRHYTGVDWSDAVSLAGLNTALYACLYGVVALAGIGLFATQLSGGVLVIVALSTGLYLLGGVLVVLAGRNMAVAGRFASRLGGLLGRIPRVGDRLAGVAGALPSFTADSADTFRTLSTRPGVVAPYALGWAGTLMIAPGLRVWLLLTGLGGGFSPALLLPVALVMAYSVTILPLTPGGVGVAEASATLVLTSLGVAPELAGAVVLLDRTFGVYLPALLGWIPAARVDLGDLFASER